MKKTLLTTLLISSIVLGFSFSIQSKTKPYINKQIVIKDTTVKDTVFYSSFLVTYNNGMFQTLQYPFGENVYERLIPYYRNQVKTIDTLQYRVIKENLH